MAIDMTINSRHAYAFQSKLLAGNGGEHIYNLLLGADRDNGVIRGRGDWVTTGDNFGVYAEAAAPNGFAGKIVAQAADGNYYVEVVNDADAVLVLQVPEINIDYDPRFTNPKNFYNKQGDIVRAYGLHKGDIFELSAEGFTTTPSAASIGKAVSANATSGKLVIAS